MKWKAKCFLLCWQESAEPFPLTKLTTPCKFFFFFFPPPLRIPFPHQVPWAYRYSISACSRNLLWQERPGKFYPRFFLFHTDISFALPERPFYYFCKFSLIRRLWNKLPRQTLRRWKRWLVWSLGSTEPCMRRSSLPIFFNRRSSLFCWTYCSKHWKWIAACPELLLLWNGYYR